ncbi:MAG: hypothetical protein ACRC5T_03145 [Cetobacterium sp.]
MWNYRNKEKNVKMMENYLLCRTLNMFKWNGLPDTIPEKELEKILQKTGKVFILELDSKNIFAFDGTLTGNQTVYGEYKDIMINNVWINLNKTYPTSTGVLGFNDSLSLGLNYIYSKFSNMLAESEISLMLGLINTRIQTLISASDETTVTSARKFLQDIEVGSLGVISENKLFDSLKISNTSDSNNLKELIEIHTYLKTQMFNEIGLHSNPNLKKERLIKDELTDGDDNIFPFIDNMLKCRKLIANNLNMKYNLNVQVEFDSVWNKDIEEPIITGLNKELKKGGLLDIFKK